MNSYGFSAEDYFGNTDLIIDPIILAYSTFLGGNGGDFGTSISIDNNGYIYITGWTASTDFPRANPFQNIYGGSTDAFMTRLSSAGNSLLHSTYLGGNARDIGRDISTDSDDNIYATGETTSTDFPTQNPYQDTQGGLSDVFVTKFSSSDASLVYSTYLGGSGTDAGQGIALDSLGSAYVTGNTKSTNFPTENPFQDTLTGLDEAFVTKLSPSGNSLQYSTFLGGSNNEGGKGIVVNDSGNAYVIGYTLSTNFPVEDAYQENRAGTVDAFITKLSSEGNSLLNSTYFGGNDWDLGRDIGLNKDGEIYVTGETKSTDFPMNNPYQDTIGGVSDAFITKFSATGKNILSSTYLSGNEYDTGLGIAVDHMGNAYITGYTKSTNFPTEDPYQAAHGGGWDDVYVTKLSFPLTLTISSGTGGSTDPAVGSHTYNSGTVVSVTATPGAGYTFSGWTMNVPTGHENDNPVIITMNSDKSITANFSVISYTISGTVSITENSRRMRVQSGLRDVVLSGFPGNPQTDSNGLYSATVNQGWSGTVTPTKPGYSFSPENRTYTTIVSNHTHHDFTVLSITPPEISLSLSSLNFGATASGIGSSAQKFGISNSSRRHS